MRELYADIGWRSILHHGEELCGDHVEVVESGGNSQVMVLADGLGSGVKASILSTLTSRIISTMMASGMTLEACVAAVADALPMDSEKHVAYCTFTIICIRDAQEMEIIQFDSPPVLVLRGCDVYRLRWEKMTVADKVITRAVLPVREGDVLVAMSDGVPNASPVATYSYTWQEQDIADYLKIFAPVGYSAKTLATLLTDECYRRYGEKPLDDATACVICMRPKKSVHILFGPPKDPSDDKLLMDTFFGAKGVHIICGGTTAKIAGNYLGKPIQALHATIPSDLPPMSTIEGVDLVTEGVLTMTRVGEYVADNASENLRYTEWSNGRDGACRIARLLLEEGTDIHFYAGRALNPAYQNPDLKIAYNVKMHIVKQLAGTLRSMGKHVTVQEI